jgi:outer membrane protein assembly factor BamB
MDAGRCGRRWAGLLGALAALLVFASPVAAQDAARTDRVTLGHTGFVAGGSLDRPPLQTRWSRSLGTSVGYPVAGGGLVFAVHTDAAHTSATLSALNAATGTTTWFRPIGLGTKLALNGSSLYAVDASGVVTAIDAASGSTRWLEDLPSNTRDTAPVADGGLLFVFLGSRLYALDETNGKVEWEAGDVPYDDGGPALDARNVYVNEGCRSAAYRRTDGRRRWVSGLSNCSSSSARIAADGAHLFTPPFMLDATTGELREQLFGGAPAVAGTVVVGLNGRTLQARNRWTGAAMWEFAGDNALSSAPIVVNHTVYVGSTTGTLFGVDLLTGEQVWSSPMGTTTTPCSYSCTAVPGATGMAAAEGALLVPYGGRLIALEDAAALDRAGLDLRILSGPNAPTAEDDAAFTFAATGTGFTYRCRLDGGGWTPCAGTAAYEGLGDGSHVFEVKTVDPEGEPIALASRGFAVLTTRPRTTITGGPEAHVKTNRFCYYTTSCSSYELPRVTFTVSDASATECRLDDRAWEPCTASYGPTSSTLTDGPHAVEIRSENQIGVVESPAARREFVVDTRAPVVTVTEQPPATTDSRSARIAWTADEDATFTCATSDGGAGAPCSSPLELANLDPGTYLRQIRARDAAGNVGTKSVTWTVTHQTEITEAPGESTSSTTATFRFRSPGSNAAVFHCRLDGGSWSDCSSPKTYSGLAVGTHAFEVRAALYSMSSYSGASGADPTPARHEWQVTASAPPPDTTPPQTTITGGAANGPNAAILSFTASESQATFACEVDGSGVWTACSSPVTFSALAAGPHTFAVRATDKAGNTDPTPATVSVTVEDPVPDETETETGSSGTPPVPREAQRAAAAPRPVAPVATGSAPAPPAAAPVTAARLRAALPSTPRALVTALATTVAAIDAKALVDEELLVGFAPSRAGRLSASLVARSRGRRIVVARGAKRFRAGESGFVAIKVTAAGRRLLRRSARVRLSVEASFKPSRGSAAHGKARATTARARR